MGIGYRPNMWNWFIWDNFLHQPQRLANHTCTNIYNSFVRQLELLTKVSIVNM